MIEQLSLKFGSTPDAPPLIVRPEGVTVFVGPNHSGKSQILREIHSYCTAGQPDPRHHLVASVEFSSFERDEAEAWLERLLVEPNKGDTVLENHVFVGRGRDRVQTREERWLAALCSPQSRTQTFASQFLRFHTLMLDGRSRIDLVNGQAGGDLSAHPTSSLQVLFQDAEKRLEVRRILHDAFGHYFIVDPTQLGQLRVRLSERPPTSEREEQSLDSEARAFHRSAMSIEDASDGVKAFTGTIAEVIAGEPHVLLIDEPEAFLHPSLAFKLGRELARASSESNKRVFASTHSSHFLMGCIQSGVPVTIVRLTYSRGVATARTLPASRLLHLMRNPLLRSTGVLEGLFYESAVVTEADVDRAFYGEINARLLDSGDPRGIDNCLFLHAQNKQTVETIVRPLRELGIPAAGVVDVDVVKEGGQVWSKLMSSANVPSPRRGTLGQDRAAVNRALEAAEAVEGVKVKRDGGVELLENEDRRAADDLFDQLGEYGVFVVRKGEVESWLPELSGSRHGPPWLIRMFEEMGDDPEDASYLAPADGDVWDFVGEIGGWLRDPGRKGIPVASPTDDPPGEEE